MTTRSLLASLAALALLGASTVARADDPGSAGTPVPASAPTPRTAFDPEPAGDTFDVRYPPPIVRLKLIVAGVVVTGLAWGVSLACAASWPYVPNPAPGAESGPPGSGQLKIPVVGPWVMLAQSGCAPDEPYCAAAKVGVRDALLVLDGIVQLAGVALIAEAIVMKTTSTPAKKTSLLGLRVGGVEVTPVPIVTSTVSGFGVGGTF